MSKKRHKIKESELQGFKYFKAISGMLESLHQAGYQRDRAVQQASQLKKVQRKLGCPRASLGSLSEASTVFDSALMQEIVTELSDQLRPISTHTKIDDLAGILTVVDGTLINALAKMTWALWRNQYDAIKAHTQFDINAFLVFYRHGR